MLLPEGKFERKPHARQVYGTQRGRHRLDPRDRVAP